MGKIQNELNQALHSAAVFSAGKKLVKGQEQQIKQQEETKQAIQDLQGKKLEPTEQEIQAAEEFESQIEADKAKQMKHLGVVVNDPEESGKFMSDWSDHGLHIGGFGEGAISREDAQKILHELSWGKPNPSLSQSVDFDRAQTAQGIAHYQSKMASANKIAQKKKLMELKERAAGGKK